MRVSEKLKQLAGCEDCHNRFEEDGLAYCERYQKEMKKGKQLMRCKILTWFSLLFSKDFDDEIQKRIESTAEYRYKDKIFCPHCKKEIELFEIVAECSDVFDGVCVNGEFELECPHCEKEIKYATEGYTVFTSIKCIAVYETEEEEELAKYIEKEQMEHGGKK